MTTPPLFDMVQMSVSGTPGTGTVTLNAAMPGYQTFASAGAANGDIVSYSISDAGNAWEVGHATYNSAGPTLSGRVVTFSSNSNAAISLTSAAIISNALLAEDLPPNTVYAAALDDVSVGAAYAAAVLKAGISGGYVGLILPPGVGTWANPVGPVDATKVVIIGGGGTGNPTTNIYTQGCGTSPALTILGNIAGGGAYNDLNNRCLIKGVNFLGLTSFYSYPGNLAGTPVAAGTGYVAGASALAIGNGYNWTVEKCGFFNYDTPHAWVNGNVWLGSMIDCEYHFTNQGACMTTVLSNSFENMRWVRGVSANNNTNLTINLPGMGGSIYFDGMSCDYPNVQQFYLETANGINDNQMPVFMNNMYFETTSDCTGTAQRGYADTQLFMTNCDMVEEGPLLPACYINPGFYARIHATDCNFAGHGVGAGQVALMSGYGGGSGPPQYMPSGSGNSQRYGGPVILMSNSLGDYVKCDEQDAFSAGIIYGSSFTLSYYQIDRPTLLSTGGTLTISTTGNPGSTSYNPYPNTEIKFITTDTGVWTFAAGSGVTIHSIGAGLTFGGKAGTVVTLIPIGSQTYLATGNMT